MEETKEELIEVVIDMIYGSAMMDKIMHSADIFEKGKQLATYEPGIMKCKPEINLDGLCEVVKNALENSKSNVVFVGISTVEGKPFVAPLHIMPGVQSISDGKRWGLFRDRLQSLGYEVTTDEHMHVLTATRKI